MTYNDIKMMDYINDVDPEKVASLVESMLANGWIGCPILVHDGALLTGSHRLAALDAIGLQDMYGEYDETPRVLLEDVAADVTDIVAPVLSKYHEGKDYTLGIDHSDIGWLLAGSWVEEYKAEMVEW